MRAPPAAAERISIHALREEGDHTTYFSIQDLWNFYPRPPRGGRRNDAVFGAGQVNFYPRPPRGGRPLTAVTRSWFLCLFLSTPSARRATAAIASVRARFLISIHALREEGDQNCVLLHLGGALRFLSTPSARRATSCWPSGAGALLKFLSTPSARRATSPVGLFCINDAISIHALREEGDSALRLAAMRSGIFLSTPSARRATRTDSVVVCFNSVFLSTPSARRATLTKGNNVINFHISIHALREEGDSRTCWSSRPPSYFYPRPPRGGRHPRDG